MALRRRAISLTAGTMVALAAALVGMSGAASAHTPSVSLTCNTDHQAVLTITLSFYSSSATHNNTVSATIDGSSVLSDTAFQSSYSNTFSAGSPFVSHTAEVIVFAWDDPLGVHGYSRTLDVSNGACQDATPSPTVVITAPPTAVVTATPFESFQGETATPADTATPFESFEGETATPGTTPPPTNTDGGPGGGSTPILIMLIALAFGGIGLGAVQSQRRSMRNR